MTWYESLAEQAMEVGPENTLVVMIGLGAIPVFTVCVTAFIKVTTLFSILRSALGLGQVPSQMVVATLSIVLSGYVMTPVISEVVEELKAKEGNAALMETFLVVEGPLSRFLQKNVGEKERIFFFSRLNPETEFNSELETLGSLIPAFMLTELREAFQLGLVLLIPFVVIDIVTATVLTGLGMVMVSPVTIALPFKVALFLACDGWLMISKGIVEGYLW